MVLKVFCCSHSVKRELGPRCVYLQIYFLLNIQSSFIFIRSAMFLNAIYLFKVYSIVVAQLEFVLMHWLLMNHYSTTERYI